MLVDDRAYVVGVDSQRDRHGLAVVAARRGAVVAQRSVAKNATGYVGAMRFAEGHAPGARVWAVEGAGHYGAGLTRYLSARGEIVHSSTRSSRSERGLQGKDEQHDPTRRASSALASNQTDSPP